ELQNTEKACCDNQQWAFSCFDGKCAEPTNLRFSVCLRRRVVVLRRQVPGVRIPSGALKRRLLHKEKIQVQQPPVLMKEKRREYPVTGSVQTVPQ
uniref:hypothetical protein n=1 Tax=Gemmiger formicilis TaxID=745368 RepID=UPI003FF143DE